MLFSQECTSAAACCAHPSLAWGFSLFGALPCGAPEEQLSWQGIRSLMSAQQVDVAQVPMPGPPADIEGARCCLERACCLCARLWLSCKLRIPVVHCSLCISHGV